MMLIAKQIALAVEQSRSINEYVKRNEVGKQTENDPSFEGMLDMTSPEKMVSESLSSNPHLLEVMGFFPDEPHDRPSILFGSYEYASNTSLFEEAREAAYRGQAYSRIQGLTASVYWRATFPSSRTISVLI
ncbi:hypothetical protein RE628_00075 [Paenibacillus sp. D2_2]|uniref:hypothetical protein n=1 Tax=Paenibacillus sp. D2_2 TaxID=3073092 RepID=UPI00281512B0|nr:hypothetical protein [Paenibacillus sp. D2_2]WMT41095.1 hypothetical protein RE628_00075 [Paenibacillus sp. D2_2]